MTQQFDKKIFGSPTYIIISILKFPIETYNIYFIFYINYPLLSSLFLPYSRDTVTHIWCNTYIVTTSWKCNISKLIIYYTWNLDDLYSLYGNVCWKFVRNKKFLIKKNVFHDLMCPFQTRCRWCYFEWAPQIRAVESILLMFGLYSIPAILYN